MSEAAAPVKFKAGTLKGAGGRIGGIALTRGAVDDVTASCLLAFASSVV